MKKQQGNGSAGGIGLFGLLGVVFITLKIIDVKPVGDWSWWWVTAPLWGGFLAVFLIMFVVLAIVAAARR